MLLFTSLVAPAIAKTPTLNLDEAIALLRSYNLVKGDDTGNLNLDKTITRAEAATVFVRAVGAEEYAQYFKDNVPFADVAGHWAAGYITMASRLGLMKGRSESVFDPQAQITNAEVLTVLLRIVEKEPAGPWNLQTIMSTADGLGFAPEGPLDVLANLPAYRGPIFRSMAIAISTVPMSDGNTALQKHIDKVPPTVQLTNVPATTVEEAITISGTAEDAVSVTVNGAAAQLSGTRFSATVQLTIGANTINVVAKDRAGNAATKSATVTRGGEVASIEITGTTRVPAGQTVSLTATPKDAAGRSFPTSMVTATVSGNIGTYNAANGTFTASNTPGIGKITFKAGEATEEVEVAVLGVASSAKSLRIRPATTATVGKSAKVEVEVLDADGNAIAYDQGRSVKLEIEGATGVTVSPLVAQTVAGIATFTATSSIAGELSLTATSGDLDSATGTVVFASSTRIVLSATPSSAAADGLSQVLIRATLQNENGQAINNNTDEDIQLELNINSDKSSVVNRYVTIRKANSASVGYDGVLIPGFVTETVKVTATITSNHKYTVVPTNVSFTEVRLGAASKFDLVGAPGTYAPNLINPLTLTVRITDSSGNTITDGSYAFQVAVSTTNNEELVNGLPTGVSLTLGNTGMVPVAGAPGAVVARTTNGTATLKLNYNKSGEVKLKIVGVTGTDDAVADDGTTNTASSGKGLAALDRSIRFAGTPSSLRLAVDLPNAKLENQRIGVLPANGTTTAKIKVYVVDAAGGWIPSASGQATLAKVDDTHTGTRLVGNATATITGGVAEFTIAANRKVDIDQWMATATLLPGLTPAPNITIATADDKLAQPELRSISGESGFPNRVTTTDTYMEVIFAKAIASTYNANTYGYVKVYRSNGTLLYTSDVMDLSGYPYVRIPKSSLPTTPDTYSVIVNNGFGDSLKSVSWPQDGTKVINETPLKIDITSVKYDAQNSKLTVYASGIVGGEILPQYLTLRNPTLPGSDYPLGGATCTAGTSSFTCTNVVLNPDDFQGTVLLVTEDGWYFKSATGQSAVADENLTNNYVSPMAYISYAVASFGTDTHDHVTGTITLYGRNLSQGRIYLNSLKINNDDALKLGATNLLSSNSTSVTITLPNYHNTTSPQSEDKSVAAQIKNLAGPNITLTADTGWLMDSSSNKNGAQMAIPVYTKVDVSRVQYNAATNTLTFSSYSGGFLGGTVNLSGLVIADLSGNPVVELDSTDTVVASYLTDGKLNDKNKFEIKLSDAHASLLEKEDPNNAADKNWSGLVWISSKPTNIDTDVYWFANGNGWYANTLPHLIYKLTW